MQRDGHHGGADAEQSGPLDVTAGSPVCCRRRMDLLLHDKVAIVTGSSRGLGLASAQALAAEGARVTLCARGAARLEEAAALVRKAAAARRASAGDAQAAAAPGARLADEAAAAAAGARVADDDATAAGRERVLAVAADVATADGVAAVVQETLEAFGGIDILINNVGLDRGAELLDTSNET